MFTWVFWKATLTTAISAAAYALLGALTGGSGGFDLSTINWQGALVTAGLTAAWAILHALAPTPPAVAARMNVGSEHGRHESNDAPTVEFPSAVPHGVPPS